MRKADDAGPVAALMSLFVWHLLCETCAKAKGDLFVDWPREERCERCDGTTRRLVREPFDCLRCGGALESVPDYMGVHRCPACGSGRARPLPPAPMLPS
jgi:hypothetical protein